MHNHVRVKAITVAGAAAAGDVHDESMACRLGSGRNSP